MAPAKADVGEGSDLVQSVIVAEMQKARGRVTVLLAGAWLVLLKHANVHRRGATTDPRVAY